MALQDVNSGNFGTSNQYIIYWTEMTEEWTDTNSNISNITVRVWAKRTNSGYETYGTGTCYCTIAGTQYSAGISSSQKITSTPICLFSKNLNIGHNADGTGRVDIYSQISMDVVSSGSNGWGFGLTTIPRASTPTLSATTFDMGTTITINTNRASTGFTHTIRYSFGNDNQNIATGVTDSCTWAVPLSLANQIPNADNGWGQVLCDTYSGGTLIGTTSVIFTAKCPSSMVPTASSLAVSIAGTGRDKTLAMYIQAISKVTASFSSSAVYSATIASNTISVKRQSDGADNQNISGLSGTIANPVALSGTYIITATATDSRGRTASVTTTITVQAYSPPTVNTFSAARSTSPTTSVLATINVAWSLAANNPTNVTVVGVDKSNVSTTLYTLTGSTAGSINTTQTYTGQVDTSAYTYTITITDSFGNVAKATATVGVSFVEFCLSKGYGAGVGKIWERGALDVGGDIYTTGKLYFAPSVTDRDAELHVPIGIQSDGGAINIPSDTDWKTIKTTGLYRMNSNVNGPIKSGINPDQGRGWWYLQVIVHDSSWGIQIAYDYRDGVYLRRWFDNGGTVTWDAWRRITDERRHALGVDGGGQTLAPNTWARATWETPWELEGMIWQPGGNPNMFGVNESGLYEIYYGIQINQSISTPFYAELWGNAAKSGIVAQWTTNNGWNYMNNIVFANLVPGINYEVVLQQQDGGYSRGIDRHKLRVKRL